MLVKLSHKLESHTVHLEGHLIELSVGEIRIGCRIEFEIDIGLDLSDLISTFSLLDNTLDNGRNRIILRYKRLVLGRHGYRQHA